MRRRSLVAADSGRATLARVIGAITAIVTLILLVGIALVLLKANAGNEIVGAIRDAASFLAGPFEGMFSFDKQRTETAVNWGVAAAVWFVAGRLLARLIAP
jgi:hypothetical protein